MKILIIDTYYQPFLQEFYRHFSAVLNSFYQENKEELIKCLFGTADFYSKNLQSFGHDAQDIIANDYVLQSKWAGEHGEKRLFDWIDKVPLVRKYLKSNWQEEILKLQILDFKPDVIYLQNLYAPGAEFLGEIKKQTKVFVVGQIASPVSFEKDFLAPYDLILSSFPHFVERFKNLGLKSEYFRIGFEETILKRLQKSPKQYDMSFVGGFSRHHDNSAVTAAATDFWGYGVKNLSPSIMRKYRGQAWGIDMYNILFNSKITLNRHINVAENYANNMRLYEATGVGAMLITDMKDNLGDLFKIGEEVETYSSKEELVEKVRYYLKNENKRLKIAKAGQKRTLREHTYKERMRELTCILNKYL